MNLHASSEPHRPILPTVKLAASPWSRLLATAFGLGLSLAAIWPQALLAAVTLQDFGYQARAPRTNLQPLLVILVRFDDATSGPTVAQTANWIFPDTPTNHSVNGVYAEMSANRFQFTNGGIVPILEPATNKYDAMKARVGEKDFGDGLYLSNLYAHAVHTNPAAFRKWDANQDNKLSKSEVIILFVLSDSLGGAGRGMADFSLPFGPGWKDEGHVYVGPPGAIATICHELAHGLGAYDLYSIWGGDEQDMHNGLSLMAGGSHLDAWHKMWFGWYEPRIYSMNNPGSTTLQAAQRRVPSAPIILYDETHGTNEYFLLEYRTRECADVPNTFYVHDPVPDHGLLIWHVWQAPDHSLLQYAEMVYPSADRHWWQCKHCRILYRESDAARICASTNGPGTHVRFGNVDRHYLIKDVPSDLGEHGWRYCVKCGGLCYEPLNNESACPAGGLHAPQSTGDYSLAKNAVGPMGHNDWTRCIKCQTLFLYPNRETSVCAKDQGMHLASQDRYTLIAGWGHRTLMSRSAPNLMFGENELWHGGTITPKLTWYDGTTNQLRISVDPYDYGDNFIRVRWSTIDPIPLIISHPTSLAEGFNSVTITVTDGTNAVPGATVNIRVIGGEDWQQLTGVNGTASFSFNLLGPKTLSVTVSKDQHTTAKGTITVGTGYLAWDPIASPARQGVSIPVTLRARSSAGVVSNFTGTATLEAFRGSRSASVVLTEFILGRSGSYWRGLQLQNVSDQPINTTGWRVAIGDHPTNINAVNATIKSLPSTLASGAFLGWTDLGGTSLWGSPIDWSQSQPGWAMILNSSNQVVDLVAWGWDNEAIRTMSPQIGGVTIAIDSQWTGDGFTIPTGNLDIYRHGYEDRDGAADFQTGAVNVAMANPNLILPFGATLIPLDFEPKRTGNFTNGAWSGLLTLFDLSEEVQLRAVAGSREGESNPFDVLPTVLHHFSFAPIASPKIWNAPFPVTITAQDASSNTVVNFSGQTRFYGFKSAPVPPVLITEIELRDPAYIEVQNVSTTSRNTTGWQLLAGDDPANINRVNRQIKALPSVLAAKQVFWTSEDASVHPLNYWGGSLNWSNSVPGWIMLLDAASNIVDFVAWGWSEEEMQSMAPSIGRLRLSLGMQWAGQGVALQNLRMLTGSLQRRGSMDYNRKNDFVWSRFTSRGYQNADLDLPLAGAFMPIALAPDVSGNFTNGIWSGQVSVMDDATNVFIQALDGAGHQGESTAFEARYLGQITLNLPASAGENTGVLREQGIINLPGRPKGITTVHLTSEDLSEIQVPSTVTISALETNATFDITVINDNLVDLMQTVTVIATAVGFSNGIASMEVLDDEATTITLRLPRDVTEGQGIQIRAGRIDIGTALDEPAVIQLLSSDTSEIQVPSSVVFPAGTNRCYFDLVPVDDGESDGFQTAAISILFPGLPEVADTISVIDNDPHHFVLDPVIPTNQTVLIPFPITIRAVSSTGQNLPAYSGYANLSASNQIGVRALEPGIIGPFTNGVWAGMVTMHQSGNGIVLIASSGGATGGSAPLDIQSGSFHHFAWDPLPNWAHPGAWLPARITACDSNNLIVTSFAGSANITGFREQNGKPARLLAFTGFAGAAPDYAATIAAISRHFTNFSLTATAATNASELLSLLGANDVFLIPAQAGADMRIMEGLGVEWAVALRTFLTNGGVIILCADDNDEQALLAGADLLRLERASYAKDSVPLLRWTDHELNAGVAARFTGRHVGAFADTATTKLIVTQDEGATVAVAQNLERGIMVVLASNFRDDGADLERVLANAVRRGSERSAENIPITTAIAPIFTNGVWEGIVTVSDSGTGVRLGAANGNSPTNHSGQFDISPLWLNLGRPQAAAELVLSWPSAGVTRYTIESSPSLLPGSFTPIASNLVATPPANSITGRLVNLDRVFYRARVEAHR